MLKSGEKSMLAYHVWVEGWGQSLVVQVIPVYGTEEHVVLYVELQEEDTGQTPWLFPSWYHYWLPTN